MFIGTLLAVVIFSDDETCAKNTNESDCIARVGVDFQSSVCAWDDTEQTCLYNEDQSSVLAMLIATIVVNIFSTPMDALLRHFLLMIKCLAIDRENRIRKEIFTAAATDRLSHLNMRPTVSVDESRLVALRKGPAMIFMAARLEKMRATIDNIDSFNELFYMLELIRLKEEHLRLTDIESKTTLIGRRSMYTDLVGDLPVITLRDNSLQYKVRRDMATALFLLHESINNRPSYAFEKGVSSRALIEADGDKVMTAPVKEVLSLSHERYMLTNIERARRIRDDIKLRMESFPDDDTREIYLMRMFLCESMVGYRRAIAERFFLEESSYGARSGLYASKTYQHFCAIFVPLYLVFFVFYIFLFGLSVGPEATKVWLAAIIGAFLEDTLLVEPVTAYFYNIFVASLAYKDIVLLSNRVFSKANIILNRREGQMEPATDYLQHFNAACRAARMYPHLYASRLLINLRDSDVPSSYMARYFRSDISSRLFKSISFIKAAFILIFLSAFPLFVQEGLVETTTALFFNTIFMTIYLFLDFDGLELFLACLGVFVILSIFGLISLSRSKLKKRIRRKREAFAIFEGANNYHSDTLDMRSEISESNISEADDVSLANIELDPNAFDDNGYVQLTAAVQLAEQGSTIDRGANLQLTNFDMNDSMIPLGKGTILGSSGSVDENIGVSDDTDAQATNTKEIVKSSINQISEDDTAEVAL